MRRGARSSFYSRLARAPRRGRGPRLRGERVRRRIRQLGHRGGARRVRLGPPRLPCPPTRHQHAVTDKVVRTDEEWRALLTPEQYPCCAAGHRGAVHRRVRPCPRRPACTTAAGAAPSSSPPRRSTTRAAAGRRSTRPAAEEAVEPETDASQGMVRTEVLCAAATRISATSSRTARRRPACATASTRPRSSSKRALEEPAALLELEQGLLAVEPAAVAGEAPVAPITRWQGSTIGIGLWCITVPIARAAFGCPVRAASAP